MSTSCITEAITQTVDQPTFSPVLGAQTVAASTAQTPTISKKCIPITLPYYDSLGRMIQLWMYKESVVGTVLEEGKLTLIPGSSISNSLNPSETGMALGRRLLAVSPRVWDLAFIERVNRIVVWPHMIAAGIDINAELVKMEKSFNGCKGHAHNSSHLDAARREGQGEVVCMNQQKNRPFDHYTEVGQAQQSVTNLIKDTKKLLSRSDITHEERGSLEKFLSKCSKHLDMTCGYRPKDTEATRDKMSPHMAKFYGENPQAAQKKAMQESLQFNRLTKSYNATNPNHPVPAKGATGGSIGGVGHECGIIEGLFDSLENLEEPVHYFFMPGCKEKAPFSDQVLKTLIHELAVGIFVHDSVPFFSLHFNRDSNLYPIIHPVYQNTLVGRAISLLDYHMKGFLHGVFYDESFIDEWHKKKDGDSRLLLSKCHDLRGYVRQHLPQASYYSMRELIQKVEFLDGSAGDDGEPKLFSEYSGFRSSFRIIAKQNSFQKTGRLFKMDGDFDVFYTIEPDAIYQAELEKYRSVFGKEPSGYLRLVKAYELMKNQIEEIMPRLPVFAELFEQLKVINFFSYYFKTLKAAQKVPSLEPMKAVRYEGIPLFPHLPVKKFQVEEVAVRFDQICALLPKEAMEGLAQFVRRKEVAAIPEGVLMALQSAMETYLQSKTSFPLSKEPEEVFRRRNMLEVFVSQAISEAEKVLQEALSQLPALEQRKASIEREVRQLEEYEKKGLENKARAESSASSCRWHLNFEAAMLYSDEASRLQKALEELQEPLRERRSLLEEITKLFSEITTNKENPFGFFMKVFQMKSRELQSVLEVTKDLPPSEREVQERIVGGCGQNMDSKAVVSIPRGEDFVQRHSLMLSGLEEGVFAPIRSASLAPDGYVFALGVEDAVTVSDKAYSYMARLLPEEEFVVQERFDALISAIQEKDEKAFAERFSPEMLSVRDGKGATVVHYAASIEGGVSFLKSLAKCKADFSVVDYFGNTPLHYAAKEGMLEQCSFLLSVRKELLNTVSKNGSSPLYIAVQHNKAENVQLLLKASADPNLSTVYGMSPLYCAIHNGFEAIALQLISERRTNIDAATEDGNTPIFLAIEMQNIPVIKALIEKKANLLHQRKDGMYPIHVAFKKASFDVCAHILFAGRCDVNARMRSGKTALYLALERNEQDFLMMLLAKNADIWISGYDEETTLMAAIRSHNHYGARNLVVNCKLNTPSRFQEFLYKKNIRGEDPLHLALSTRQPLALFVLTEPRIQLPPPAEYLLLLAKNFIDPVYFEGFVISRKFTPEEYRPAYYEACRVGYLLGTEIMRRNHVSWDFTDEKGWTPVHFAAKYGDLLILKPFLEKKPQDLLQVTKDGLSIAAIAAMHHQKDFFKMLVKEMKAAKVDFSKQYYGKHLLLACVEAQNTAVADALLYETFDAKSVVDDQDRTAIHYASMRGDVEMIDLLVRRGGDWLALDKSGKSAVHYAFEYEHEDAIAFFLSPSRDFPLSPSLLSLITPQTDLERYRQLIRRKLSIEAADEITGRTPLFEAIRVDNYAIFRLLLQSGANIHHVAKDGLTPFLYAAKMGFMPYVEFLYEECSAHISSDGKNALHLACIEGHEMVVQHLLQRKMDPAVPDKDGKTALMLSLQGNIWHIVHILQGRGFEVQKRVEGVEKAVKLGRVEEFFSMIEHLPLNHMLQFSEGKMPLLHYIYDHSPTPFITSVLEKRFLKIPGVDPYVRDLSGKTIYHKKAMQGADIDFSVVSPLLKDDQGRTILHCCALCAAPRSEQSLLLATEHVKTVDVEDNAGVTPLLLAIRYGRQNYVEILLKAKAFVNKISSRGITPLGEASLRGHELIAFLLLQNQANPNQPLLDRHMTPLHVAVSQENVGLAKVLLDAGANSEQGMIQNVRPIHLAAQKGSIKLLELLKSYGALFTSKDDRGWTLAHHAALSDNPELFAFFRKNKVFFNVQAVKVADSIRGRKGGLTGETAFHVAAQRGNPYVMRALFANGGNNEIFADEEISPLVTAAACVSKSAVKFFTTFRIMKDEGQVQKASDVAIGHDAVSSLRVLYPDPQKLLDMPFRDGKNAGHLAAERGSLRTIFYLHMLGLDFSAKDIESSTPFFLAVDENKLAVARYFLRQTDLVDIHAKTSVGGTYLHSAVYKGHLDMACLLLTHGALLEVEMPIRGKVLHIALRNENLPMVRLLLAAGAQIDLECMSVMPKNPEICAVVEKYAKLRSATVSLGDSLIHTAIRFGEIQFFSTIVQLENIDAPNKEGKTPLQLAIELNAKIFIQQLLTYGASHAKEMDGRIGAILEGVS